CASSGTSQFDYW
nr:immunoglobulin heavy chain junction region [Macaca mulatta]